MNPNSEHGLRPHQPALSQEQIRAYRDDGYLTLRGRLDPALLARLRSATTRLWEDGRALQKKSRHYDLDAAHCPEHPRIRRISSPNELDPVFCEIAFESVLGDIAADLVGGAVKFYHAKLNFKLPAGGAEIGWHQDWPVFPHTNTDLVALSVPLDSSLAENGCLRTIARSHLQGPRSHWHGGQYMLNCNAAISEQEVEQAIYNEVDPGDIVAHHGLTVHGSGANLSDRPRTTLIIQYAAADAFAYTAPVIDSRHRNCMVRGEAARHARVEEGIIELPPDFRAGYSSIFTLQSAPAGLAREADPYITPARAPS